MSTYKDCKPEPNYDYQFFWYVTDQEAGEFLTCCNCHVEAPLHEWVQYTGSSRWLCEICSNLPEAGKHAPIAAVANVVLTQLGKFDDVEVKEYRGDGEDEE